jgi:hypothetical protein
LACGHELLHGHELHPWPRPTSSSAARPQPEIWDFRSAAGAPTIRKRISVRSKAHIFFSLRAGFDASDLGSWAEGPGHGQPQPGGFGPPSHVWCLAQPTLGAPTIMIGEHPGAGPAAQLPPTAILRWRLVEGRTRRAQMKPSASMEMKGDNRNVWRHIVDLRHLTNEPHQ